MLAVAQGLAVVIPRCRSIFYGSWDHGLVIDRGAFLASQAESEFVSEGFYVLMKPLGYDVTACFIIVRPVISPGAGVEVR